jgi:hypothetical protein
MADRGASAGVLTELNADSNRPVYLIEIQLDAGTVYMCNHDRTVTWNANDYLGVGYFLGVDDIEETLDFILSGVSGLLSGVDQSWVSTVLSIDYTDRPIVIYQGFLDTDFKTPITDPFKIFEGRISAAEVEDDPGAENGSGTTVVRLEASSLWTDFERRPGRRTNHEIQQLYFAGDLGFEFASEFTEKIYWGRTA